MTSTSDSLSTRALSELLATGRTAFSPELVKYVCHTSTIPLATTVDEQYVLRDDENTDGVSHSTKYMEHPIHDELISYRCCKKHCMYVKSRGGSDDEILRKNCPCGNVVRSEIINGEDVDVYLQPLCFLQIIKELRYNFGYNDATSTCETDRECCHNEGEHKSNRPRIDFSAIMYCQNSQSIMDSGYSRPLRNAVGVSGWDNVKDMDTLIHVLDHCYWFRRYVSTRDKKTLLKEGNIPFNFSNVKQCITQTLHTLNGVIAKKLLLFPCEMEGYASLAAKTADLFCALVSDYLNQPEEGTIPSSENSIFIRMKNQMKRVKEQFCSTNREIRYDCLEMIINKDVKCAFAKFWASTIRRLKRRVIAFEDEDYTLSIAWINTMSGFSQTRNLGYLPPWVAEFKRKQFRENIGREHQVVDKKQLLLIRSLIHQRQEEMGIEKNFLIMPGRESKQDFVEVINSIKLPLKPSASVNSTVREGGKVEDARLLFEDACKRKWKVPVRDLDDGTIDKWIEFTPELRTEKPAHEGYLFWLSLQILMNDFSRRFAKYKPYFVELPGSEHWEEQLWTMSIVHISEPGKERNLTKTSALVSWVLTICSKISQMVLAYNQDHRAGLVLSAQDWMHQRRVSSESYEAFWMYDEKTRRRMRGIWNGFQDWTESTDYIPREVGGISLMAWLEYIAFPSFYKGVVLRIVQMDYDVKEYLHTSWEDGAPHRKHYVGKVTEGFMMSMPLTKTVLHLMHDVNIGLVHTVLADLGVKVDRIPTYKRENKLPFNMDDLRIQPSDVE